MKKTLAPFAGPNGELDMGRPARRKGDPSSNLSDDHNNILDIFNILSRDKPCNIYGEEAPSYGNMRGRRKHKRLPVDNVEILGEISFADKAEIINISENGVLLKVPRKMDIGKKYTLKICCREKKIVVRAAVIWSTPSRAQRTPADQIIPSYTAGMEFKDIWNEHKKILKKLISQIEASAELVHSC